MASFFAGSGGSSSLLGAAKAGSVGEEMAFGVAMSGTEIGKNPCPCLELTLRQRILGFISCFSLGFLISIIATTKLWVQDYVSFAELYSIGNILALLSTGFLVGPISQVKNMFHSKRIGATLVYLIMIATTLAVALAYDGGGKGVLVVICAITQGLALTWYTLSYIPFARDMVIKCVRGAC